VYSFGFAPCREHVMCKMINVVIRPLVGFNIYTMTTGMLIFYVWITATKCSSENVVSWYKSAYRNV